MTMPGSQSEAKSAPKKRSARHKPEVLTSPPAASPGVQAPDLAVSEAAFPEAAVVETGSPGVVTEVTVNERSVEDQVVEVAGNLNTSTSGAPAGATDGPPDGRAEFLVRQRASLIAERATYTTQAEELKAQADSLALEHEPGDVQFDEEGGEGGTSNVDRELDLILSAQARASITEIDLALGKIDNGTYGICEQCGDTIPEARLEALPHASLCVACKSGGLSSRR
jgi:DnaK suppressor protein